MYDGMGSSVNYLERIIYLDIFVKTKDVQCDLYTLLLLTVDCSVAKEFAQSSL